MIFGKDIFIHKYDKGFKKDFERLYMLRSTA